VTSAARTLVGLGAVTPHLIGPAMNDAVLRGLASYPWLWRTVMRLSAQGRDGVAVLRNALDMEDPSEAPTESALEDAFVRLLRRAGLPVPARQRWIGPRRVDFFADEARAVFELDGRQFHVAQADRVRDRQRELELRALGLIVVRFTWIDLKHFGDLVVAEARSILRPAA